MAIGKDLEFAIRTLSASYLDPRKIEPQKWKGESVHLSIGEYPVFTKQENFSLDVLAEHSISIQDAYVTLSAPR